MKNDYLPTLTNRKALCYHSFPSETHGGEMTEKKFDDEKQIKALAWLNEKWPSSKRNCEVCDCSNWSVSKDFITPLVFDGGLQLGKTAYPVVGVICQNCGNTKYFNAVKMGLLEEITKETHGKTSG